MGRKRRPAPPPAAAPPAPPRPASRALRLVAPLALAAACALGFAARVIPAHPVVFPQSGGVTYLEPDAYYHLRHARHVAEHFPRVQRWDPALYPAGAPAFYAGLYDVLIAGASWVAAAGRPPLAIVEEVAAWVPPALAVASFVALFLLVRAAAGTAAGIAAALLLLLYPGSFMDRTLLGYSDHHAAEVLLALLVVHGLCRALDRAGPWWRPDLLSALPFALLLFTWYGAPIYLVLAAASLLVAGSVGLVRDGHAAAVARAAFRWGAGVLLLSVPAALLAPWLMMERRMFVRASLATAALAVGLPAYLRLGAWLMRRGAPRAATAIGGVLLVAIALALAVRLVPGLDRLAGELLAVKTALVREQQAVDLHALWRRFGPAALCAAAALPLLLASTWRRRDESLAPLTAACAGTLVVALWLRTHDYDYAAAAFVAALAAIALGRALPRGWIAWAVAAALLVAPLVLRAVPLRLATRAGLEAQLGFRPGVMQALRWLRAHAPPLAQPLDAEVARPFRHPPGNYGVLGFWDQGHFIATVGERPTNATGALTTGAARVFVAGDEAAALDALGAGLREGEQFRYVLADVRLVADVWNVALELAGATPTGAPAGRVKLDGRDLPLFDNGERYRRSLAVRLMLEDGDDLARLRLVYASPARHAVAYVVDLDGGEPRYNRRSFAIETREALAAWLHRAARGGPVLEGRRLYYGVAVTSSAKLYEQVRGARLTGVAAPGAAVEARLDLVLAAAGERRIYRRRGRADAAGRFELTVPYPTVAEPGADVTAAGPYSVVAGGLVVGGATVTAADVAGGAAVSVR